MGSVVGLGIAAVIIASAFWVAINSERYEWSRWHHPRHDDWNPAGESFGTWLFVCVVLWPVFFPGYFYDRRYAPRKPDESKVRF